MPSPFPGMDPYLENPEFWSEVHNRSIVAISDALSPQLRPKYRVAIEKRTYLSEDEILVGIADVAVLTGRSDASLNPIAATLPARYKPPVQIAVPLPEEVRERYLEIREVSTGQVITVLKILSPKNKRSGVGRTAYERKRQQILSSTTHLVEVDLLRSGPRMHLLGDVPVTSYYILVSRSHHRSIADLYAFNLREEIPIFSLPLAPNESEPEVDLQELLNGVYDRASLDLVINYTQHPTPALKGDAVWVEALLGGQGFRV